MYELDYTGKFKKDMKTCQKRGYNMDLLRQVIEYLEKDGQVPGKYNPHTLKGKLRGFWECHITPDWILIYDVQDKVRLVSLARTGTHSDLLSKK